ncbi:MAG: LamG-like jellyroll fold domain-containing protein, partial [bacterium]
FSITYAAAPGEKVVLSGGRTITGWKKGTNEIWTAEIPEAKEGRWFFRQLTVNDRRATRARWPDAEGVLRIAGVSDGVTQFTFNQNIPGGNLAGQGAELVVLENWSVTRGLVASNNVTRLATVTPMGVIGHEWTTASSGRAAFIEGGRAFLDKPGEWFLDRAAGVLHYIPLASEDPSTAVVVAPLLTRLVAIVGEKGHPVRNLRFMGIRFEHADFPLPAFGYSEIQAAHYQPAVTAPAHVQSVAVACDWAEGCRFEGCRFAHLNGSGIGLGPGCRKNAIEGCTIEDIGGNGVMIGWRGTGKLSASGGLDADWADPADAPASNEVANCHIRRCAADSRGGVGIWTAFSTDTRIAHNLVHDLPYTGISVGFKWNSNPTTQARCVVEYNHIYDVMKQLADGGGIYTLGFQPGTTLRGNRIHDVLRSEYAHGGAANNGFFVDEGSKGFLFVSNLVYRTSGGAVRFNQCNREWHTWTDNVFQDGQPAMLEVAHAASLEPEQLTIEAWVQLSEFPGGKDTRRWIAGKNGNEWIEGHYALIIDGKRVGAYLNIGGGQANAFAALGDKEVLKAGRRQHLAMTFDGAVLKAYCDGVLAASLAVNRKRVPGNGPFAVGRRPDGFLPIEGATIGDVRLYNRALSPEEIAARIRGGDAPAGCVGTWLGGGKPQGTGGGVEVEAGLEPAFRARMTPQVDDPPVTNAAGKE